MIFQKLQLSVLLPGGKHRGGAKKELLFFPGKVHMVGMLAGGGIHARFQHAPVTQVNLHPGKALLRELCFHCGVYIKRKPLHHKLMVDSTTTVAELVSRGMGVSFLPEYAIERYLQSGELTKLSLDVPPQSYYSQILYHKDKWAAPYVDGFVEIVRRLCPENQA